MAYDSAITTFTVKTDKVDLVQAAHMNSVQSEIVTIETILGTNVKGDRSDLKTRLNNALDADGSVLSGTSFPSPALASQGFYRTDLDTFYFRNAANTAWSALGTSLSNLVFDDHPGSGGSNVTSGSYTTIDTSKFRKISGINTLTYWVKGAGINPGADRGIVAKMTVGTQSVEVTVNTGSTTPAWESGTIDVSGLTNGTTYDITNEVKKNSSEPDTPTYWGSLLIAS